MTPMKAKPPQLPLNWLRRAARRHRSVRLIANHAHVLQILEDHAYELTLCKTDEEKHQVCAECRRQLWLAVLGVIGLDGAMHGVVMASTGHIGLGMMFFLLGVLTAYLAMHFGGH